MNPKTFAWCLSWVGGTEGLLASQASHAAKPALLINESLPADLVLERLDLLEDSLRRLSAEATEVLLLAIRI